jgi:hypothetical protein
MVGHDDPGRLAGDDADLSRPPPGMREAAQAVQVGAWPGSRLALAGLLWRPPTFGQGTRTSGAASGVAQRGAQEELDLRVGAAQLVGGPARDGVVHGGVEADQDALPLDRLAVGHPV